MRRNSTKSERNKKALSTIFISLYLATLIIMLDTTLLLAIQTSSNSMNQGLQIEQARNKERIGLVSPWLNLTDDYQVISLAVNNTGSITLRIRALYIGSNLVCDPSTFPLDSYVNPSETLSIQLQSNLPTPIELNDSNLNAYWTVVTERGTRVSDLGMNGAWPPPWVQDPNRFYIGPLMIVFDQFKWKSPDYNWQPGWAIPKGEKQVTWRILLANVDTQKRTINITEDSCLTLVSNDSSELLSWFVDLPLGVTEYTLEPGKFHFVDYLWSKARSDSGAQQQGVTLTASATCATFLTFHGKFIYTNGTTMPYAQSIPFEATQIK